LGGEQKVSPYVEEKWEKTTRLKRDVIEIGTTGTHLMAKTVFYG